MRKILTIMVILSVALSSFLFFAFRNSTVLSVEGKFGIFCLNCSILEKGSADGAYGFGLAYCDNEIRQMSNTIKYDEIDRFKLFLKEKGLVKIVDKVVKIEIHLKSNNNKKYFTATKEYLKEIELLNDTDKEIIAAYFK